MILSIILTCCEISGLPEGIQQGKCIRLITLSWAILLKVNILSLFKIVNHQSTWIRMLQQMQESVGLLELSILNSQRHHVVNCWIQMIM